MENALTARAAVKVLECGGLAPTPVENVSTFRAQMAQKPAVVCGPVHLAPVILEACAASPETRILLYTDTATPEAYQFGAQSSQIIGIFGLRYPGAAPRHWETLAIAHRLAAHAPAPPQAPLAWGHLWHEAKPSTPGERDRTVSTVEAFAGRYLPPHRTQGIAELTHELLMNAMYDAPSDASNAPLFAADRKQEIALTADQSPTLGYGCDGLRLVISVSDPFGGLNREAVFGGVHRGLSAGAMDQSGGGAGLGLSLILQASAVLFVDVIPQSRTQITSVVELDIPAREWRKLPRSLHYLCY